MARENRATHEMTTRGRSRLLEKGNFAGIAILDFNSWRNQNQRKDQERKEINNERQG
jgi:hypothetical protein